MGKDLTTLAKSAPDLAVPTKSLGLLSSVCRKP